MTDTLVVSISGIRGIFGRGLNPDVIVRYVTAYGNWIFSFETERPLVVVGRDARVSGPECARIVIETLREMGISIIDAGLATTPTVEMAVIAESATGGIVLSASHNPAEWNALKLLNGDGEFLSPTDAAELIRDANAQPSEISPGAVTESDRNKDETREAGSLRQQDYLDYHVDQVMGLPEISAEVIARRDFRVVVDAVNSVGGIAIPEMLMRLGVRSEQIIKLNCEPTGIFAHPAEPLPQNLTEVCARVLTENADLGIVVDPDADRLALIADGGVYVSEELTQVIAADFWWKHHSGPFVTNLSSSRAIEVVAQKKGHQVFRSSVGEINVVEEMKRVGAVIGGEGNGGVILPALHYGRDALVGTALILQHLAESDIKLSEMVSQLPQFKIVKMKTDIGNLDPDRLLASIADNYSGGKISTQDGVKIDFEEGWVHMRKSNTEPIIRVYAESESEERAISLGERFMAELRG